MKKKELNLALAVPQPCWTKHWLLQGWGLTPLPYKSVTYRPRQHGTVVLTLWIFTENNLECDYCLVNLPTAVVAFLTVNLGQSEEGTECRRCCLKTPLLRLNEEANDSGLNLPLFNVCSLFPKFFDAELHLLRGFITLKEKRYCITISIRFQLTWYCLFRNAILRRMGGNCSEFGNYMVCFKRTKGFRKEWMHERICHSWADNHFCLFYF